MRSNSIDPHKLIQMQKLVSTPSLYIFTVTLFKKWPFYTPRYYSGPQMAQQYTLKKLYFVACQGTGGPLAAHILHEGGSVRTEILFLDVIAIKIHS